MNKKPKWVIFDVGGVIFDYVKAFQTIAQYLKVDETYLIQQVFQNIGPGVLGEITFDEDLKNALIYLKRLHEFDKVRSLWWNPKWIVPDTSALIRELKVQGYHLALFTNNWVDMGEKIYTFSPEIQTMDKRFESSKEKLCKPNRKFYELVERETHSSGNNIMLIDDTIKNLDTATEMKWQTYHYGLGDDDGKTSNNKIRKLLLK